MIDRVSADHKAAANAVHEARFHDVDLTNARVHQVDLTGVMIRGAAWVNVDINGEIENLRVNGVDVVPLVEAELNRRYPELLHEPRCWVSRRRGTRSTFPMTTCIDTRG